MYLKAWLLFVLGSVIGGALGGGGAGFFVGFAYGLICSLTHNTPDYELLAVSAGVLGFLISVPISFLIFRWCVNGMLKKAFPAS